MEFDKSRVFTPFNCEEVKVGSRGFFAQDKQDLLHQVDHVRLLSELTDVTDCEHPFEMNNGYKWRYFYLVIEPKEEPKEKAKRPCTREELVEMLKKQGLPMLMSGGIIYTIELILNYVKIAYAHHSYEELCEQFTLLDGTELWVKE